MGTIEIYDPPQSCATGACDPDAVDPLAQLESSLVRLGERGIAVARYNLGLDPEAFASNPLVKGTLKQDGMACLPLVVADGAILCKGRYPSAGELEARLGIAIRA